MYTVVAFPVAVVTQLTKENDLKGYGPVQERGHGGQGEEAGRSAPEVRKQRERNAGFSSLSPLYLLRTQDHRMVVALTLREASDIPGVCLLGDSRF